MYYLLFSHCKNCKTRQTTDDNTAHAPKDTKTHSEDVLFIAFPLQKYLHERVTLLRYTLIACILS
jgi:hypothetical protein